MSISLHGVSLCKSLNESGLATDESGPATDESGPALDGSGIAVAMKDNDPATIGRYLVDAEILRTAFRDLFIAGLQSLYRRKLGIRFSLSWRSFRGSDRREPDCFNPGRHSDVNGPLWRNNRRRREAGYDHIVAA